MVILSLFGNPHKKRFYLIISNFLAKQKFASFKQYKMQNNNLEQRLHSIKKGSLGVYQTQLIAILSLSSVVLGPASNLVLDVHQYFFNNNISGGSYFSFEFLIGAFYFGAIFGAVAGSYFSAYMGRSRIILLCYIGLALTGLLYSQTTTNEAIFAFQVMLGQFWEAAFLATQILAYESIPPIFHTRVIILFEICRVIGKLYGVVTSDFILGSTYLWTDWGLCMAITTFSSSVCLTGLCVFIKESPYYLQNAQRYEELDALLEHMQRLDARKYLKRWEGSMQKVGPEVDRIEEEQISFNLDLLKNREMRILAAFWFCQEVIAKGIYFMTPYLLYKSNETYYYSYFTINFISQTFYEILPLVLALIFAQVISKKTVLIGSFGVTAVLLLLTLIASINFNVGSNVVEFSLRYLYPYIILASLDYQGASKRPMVLGIGLIAKQLGLFTAGILDVLFYSWATKIPVIIFIILSVYCCYNSFIIYKENQTEKSVDLEVAFIEDEKQSEYLEN